MAENHKLEPDDTFSELLEMGILKIPHDPDTILRFQLLSPSGEILKKETRVASRVNDGDTLTFIMVARDPRAHAWIPRVNSDPDCLKCAPEYARSDRFVVMEAVAKDGQALGYAVPELRADKEVVSRAVSQDGRSLQFASPELRDDKEVALKAVLNQGRALEFASERLRGDFEMVLCACTNEGNSLEFATKEWQKHQKIVLLAVDRPYQQAKNGNRNMQPIQFAAEELRSNYDFMWQAVRVDTRCVEHATESIRNALRVRIQEENLDKNRWYATELEALHPGLLEQFEQESDPGDGQSRLDDFEVPGCVSSPSSCTIS